MYNFRYHLVTIISIFAALALGLLLGVALTGSDLVRDASSNLAQSLTAQFDELNATNRQLTEDLEQERQFSSQLAAGWQNDRLQGRNIAILTRAPGATDPLVEELSSLITKSGGIPVVIRIDAVRSFGIEDEQALSSLKLVLPETPDEDYSITLARALAKEWSFAYTADENSGTPGSTGTAGATGTGAAGGTSDTTAAGAVNTEDMAAAFEANYPLTNKLVDLGYIEVQASYLPLMGSTSEPGAGMSGSIALATQQAAYQHAQDLLVPYGINGVIDTAVYNRPETSSNRYDTDTVALRISQQFELLGQAGELSYPLLGSSAAPPTNGSQSEDFDQNLSYFSLLVQNEAYADAMIAAAQDTDVSCVLSSKKEYRDYSVIALLTGATQGIYGSNISGTLPFPTIPADSRGNAPFIGTNS